MEGVGVFVVILKAHVEEKVPGKMDDDEADQQQACQAHHPFSAD
jgi:hypothetical protein